MRTFNIIWSYWLSSQKALPPHGNFTWFLKATSHPRILALRQHLCQWVKYHALEDSACPNLNFFFFTLNMNILSRYISQVLHRKQMAYSNLDYLRRFYLQRYYFQRCRQSVGKPNRMCSSLKLVAAWLLPSLGQRGWGEGTIRGLWKERRLLSEEEQWLVLEGYSLPFRKGTRTINPVPSLCVLPLSSCQTPYKQNSNENPRTKEPCI